MKKITEDEFYEKFTTVKNHLDESAGFDSCLFETYGEELDYVFELSKKENRVWTVIENDDGEGLTYATGFHLVNRLGFLITEETWSEEMEVKVDL